MKRGRIGVMGGSFNPVHIGHLMVAEYVRQQANLDEVLMMLSPRNPLKSDADNLADDTQRMEMLRIACADYKGLTPCDIELSMPRPSYTIDTLNALSSKYPEYDFTLIIGSDNWQLFDRWRASQEIIERYGVIVYPRPDYRIDTPLPAGVTLVEAPTVNLSGTFVRNAISQGVNVDVFLPKGVYNYIIEHKVYDPTIMNNILYGNVTNT